MDLFGTKKSKERKSHFRNLIGLAAADGKIHENERELITLIGKNMGLSRSEIEEVANSDDISFSPPKDQERRFEQLHDLVMVMLIDGKIHRREMDYCMEMAINLGFRPTAVEELIKLIVDQAEKGAQKEEVKSEASDFLDGF